MNVETLLMNIKNKSREYKNVVHLFADYEDNNRFIVPPKITTVFRAAVERNKCYRGEQSYLLTFQSYLLCGMWENLSLNNLTKGGDFA